MRVWWLVAVCLLLAASQHAVAAPMRCVARSLDGQVSVSFEATRVGALASDLTVSYLSPSSNAQRTFVVKRADVTGFYFVHNRLSVYYATLVDDREAILDLTYDVAASQGTISMHLSPAAVVNMPEVAADAGKVELTNRPVASLEIH